MIADKKEKGNKAFKLGNYEQAIAIYSEIIESVKDEEPISEANEYVICLNNRSICYLKLEKYENALNDTNEGID
jgi:tetratricopeptide (TPR) repeat protein